MVYKVIANANDIISVSSYSSLIFSASFSSTLIQIDISEVFLDVFSLAMKKYLVGDFLYFYIVSLENSLQKNISLQHCQEKLISQREGFWGQPWKVRKGNTKEGNYFLHTASADHSPEFLCNEASILEDCVDMQRSGQQGEGLRYVSYQVYDQRKVMTLVQAFHL